MPYTEKASFVGVQSRVYMNRYGIEHPPDSPWVLFLLMFISKAAQSKICKDTRSLTAERLKRKVSLEKLRGTVRLNFKDLDIKRAKLSETFWFLPHCKRLYCFQLGFSLLGRDCGFSCLVRQRVGGRVGCLQGPGSDTMFPNTTSYLKLRLLSSLKQHWEWELNT